MVLSLQVSQLDLVQKHLIHILLNIHLQELTFIKNNVDIIWMLQFLHYPNI